MNAANSDGTNASDAIVAAATVQTSYRRPLPTWLVIVMLLAALATQGVRIGTVRSSKGDTPFHSANDRSRWCAVAALVEQHRFEIDDYLKIRGKSGRTWYTIDLVRHRGRDGKQHFYSSKPPLLSAMHALAYQIVHSVTGLVLVKQPFTTARIILCLVNLVPLAICYALWARYWQRHLTSPWAALVMMIFMLWGTFVSTFANTLNNHLPGALSAGLSLWAVLKIVEENRMQFRWFWLAAASAGMCAVCELPALAWCAAVIVLLVQINWSRALAAIAAGMVPLAIAFAIVNYLAHGDLKPPYAHRAVGAQVTTLPANEATAVEELTKDRAAIVAALREKGFEVTEQSVVKATRTSGVQELWDEGTQYRFALVLNSNTIAVHHWDDWYDYPESYWYPDRKQGVDKGEPSRLNYLFQTTFGHHGVFSLTPMWLLLPYGAWLVFAGASGSWFTRLFNYRVQVMLAIVATSLVCFAFYMARPLEDRNYGGVSCGFRWMFWFIPLWLWLVSHSLDRIRSVEMRGIVWILLAISLFSALWPWSNPWTQPWLMTW